MQDVIRRYIKISSHQCLLKEELEKNNSTKKRSRFITAMLRREILIQDAIFVTYCYMLLCHLKKVLWWIEKLNKKVGNITMFLVYMALQISITVPSISRIPIMSDTAISIVMNNEDRLAQFTQFEFRN